MKGKKKTKAPNQPSTENGSGEKVSKEDIYHNTNDVSGAKSDSYFMKVSKLNNETCNNTDNLQNVHVPGPDDAALPYNIHQNGFINENDKIIPKANCDMKNIQSNQKKQIPNTVKRNEKKEMPENENKKSVVVPEKKSLKQQKLAPLSLKPNQSTKKKFSKKVNAEPKCKRLTEYFPIRKSDRRTHVTIKKEKQKEVEDAIISEKEDGFQVKEFTDKGRGIVSTKLIRRGDFVLEYHGDLIDMEEAKTRERLYAKEENIGCYMYYFTYRNKQYCVDATKESGRLGRLVNHSKKGNLRTEAFAINDKPHLILVAHKDIHPGEELLYDYGDRSKKSLECHPWLAT